MSNKNKDRLPKAGENCVWGVNGAQPYGPALVLHIDDVTALLQHPTDRKDRRFIDLNIPNLKITPIDALEAHKLYKAKTELKRAEAKREERVKAIETIRLEFEKTKGFITPSNKVIGQFYDAGYRKVPEGEGDRS